MIEGKMPGLPEAVSRSDRQDSLLPPESRPNERFDFLSKPKNVGAISEGTTVLHISCDISLLFLKEVLEACHPHLKTIQLPPWSFERHGRSEGKGQLLQKHGVNLVQGRQKEKLESGPHREQQEDYQKRRRFLLAMDEGARALLDTAEAMGFVEVEMSKRYFRLDQYSQEPQISLAKLARGYPVEYWRVREGVMAMLTILGCPEIPTGMKIITAAKRLGGKYRLGLEAQQDLPPEMRHAPFPRGLRAEEFKNFIALVKFQRESPEVLEELQRSDPKAYFVLAWYYGLEDGQHLVHEKIGQKLDPKWSASKVYTVKRRALEQLGILEG